jgi:hypothetical protein
LRLSLRLSLRLNNRSALMKKNMHA